jgi:hypothetical protein
MTLTNPGPNGRGRTQGIFDYVRNDDGSFTWTDQHGNTYTGAPLTRWITPEQDSTEPSSDADDRDD